jgi:hypothetical protein
MTIEGQTSDGTRDKLDSETKRSRREADFARRALIRAGWTVPVVLAVGLTRDPKAQTEYGGTPPPPPPD